jgi:hypothetical protein
LLHFSGLDLLVREAAQITAAAISRRVMVNRNFFMIVKVSGKAMLREKGFEAISV